MEIQNIQITNNLRKIEIKLDESLVVTTPRQAITTTNLNHSNQVDYKTPFLEVLISSINDLKSREGYLKSVKKAKDVINKNNNKNKIPIITIKGIASKRIKVSDFKLICRFQEEVGFKKIRLFFKENLYKKIDDLMKWVKENYGEDYYFVLDHNMNFPDFKRLYSSAIEREHNVIYFINRKLTKNNIEKFVFIQRRRNDKIIRWISSLSKKTADGSLNPLFHYWMGYDVTSFMTRGWTYQIPEYELEVIKNFRYVPATSCAEEKCVLIPKNTLLQSIEKYALKNRDSIPCSVFSIVELNADFEEFSKEMNPNKIIPLISSDIKNFNKFASGLL